MAVRIPRKIQWNEMQQSRARDVQALAQLAGLRLIVCGGRDFADREVAFRVLDYVHRERGVREIIEGGQRGADTLAGEWADARGIKRTTVPADWKTLRSRAGPVRNAAMIALKPDGVIALPGGAGTANCCDQARAAGIIVWKPLGRVRA